ncbi:MAG TPA: ATP-binding protein [Geobacteraceae bacterium]|nr:ATP-binding protein [Geobacteraceae bacterium]
MKINIRWKLVASYFALVVIIAGVLYGYLNHILERNLIQGIKENLFNEARLARSMADGEILEIRRDSPSLADTVGKDIKARVTIIALDGQVLGDSKVGREGLSRMENHSDRPEFGEALKNGSGSSIRYSSTLGTQMMYVALPFRSRTGQSGVIRLALPLSQVENALSELHSVLGAAVALALLCSLALGYIFSNVTTRPLRTIAAAAARIGKGDLGFRVPVAGRDEAGELASVMNDMAARIEAQMDRISTERNRLDTILSSMGEGVMVTDNLGTVTLANPAFRNLFSLKEYVEGESLIEITRQPELNDTLKKVLATREEILEEIIVHGPEEKGILTHWVPLLENGHMTGVVAVFHDISDIKKLEKIRRDFVANVSHELRTPVAVIKGYAETLITDGQNMDHEKAAHFSKIIHNHAERLTSLISDLLTLSQLESGKLELNMQPTTVQGALNRACSLLEPKAKDKEISLHREIGEGTPQVLADLGRLEQVFINLLDNAIKYTPQNGAIVVSVDNLDNMVRIDVTDTGIGIPAKDLPRIFERFYRVDAARSRELGGTGLGLSIVKHIVQAHGGVVSVESEPGKGSTFSFTLRKA